MWIKVCRNYLMKNTSLKTHCVIRLLTLHRTQESDCFSVISYCNERTNYTRYL